MKSLITILMLLAATLSASGVSVLESHPGGMVLRMTSSTPQYRNIEMRGRNFSVAVIEGADNLSEFSLPRMPVYRTWVEIPIGAEIEVAITDAVIENLDGPAWPIDPGLLSASKCRSREDFVMELSPEVYQRSGSWPEEWVRVVYAGHMRGRNLAMVEVMPMRWDPAGNSCELLSEATISLSFEGGDLGATYASAARHYSPHFEVLLSNLAVNYGIYEGGCDTPPAPYLIVGHEDFVTTGMDGFVSWKESLGFDVTMVDLSVTGSTHTEIASYIHNAIENWPDPPVYVLLVGDTDFLPGHSATTYGGVTDLYYSTLDNGNYFPDVFIGRFSVTTTGEAVLMAERVIDYEQNVSGSTPWVQNTCWIASNDNSYISEGTHNYCIDTYLAPLGYTWDKVYPAQGGTAADAVASINSGISMLTFSGHGWYDSWGDMSFNQSNFDMLNNADMLPGVLSHSCVTGDYGWGSGTAWCETWTRTPERGGLWFWGSVPSSYWDEDDIQQRAEYEYFLDIGATWPMGFLNGGKMAVYTYYSGGGRTHYYYEGYNLMGDPSVQMAVWGLTEIEGTTPSPVPGGITVNNPVRTTAMVTLSGNGPAELNVFDLTGRLIATPFRGNISGSHSFGWDTRSLAAGMYFLRLEQEGTASTARVMVVR